MKINASRRTLIVLPFIALAMVIGSSHASAEVADSKSALPSPIIGHWSFDADADNASEVILDQSGNDLHGKIHPASDSVSFETGSMGSGIRFSDKPAAWVQLPTSELLNLQPPYTISAWVKMNASDSGPMEIISKKWDSGGKGFRLRVKGGDLAYEFGSHEVEFESVKTQGGRLSEGKWAHVAVAHDTEDVSLFINGLKVASVTPQQKKLDYLSSPCVIGNYVGNKEAGYQFVGVIDEVVIVGKALAAEAVLDLAARTRDE